MFKSIVCTYPDFRGLPKGLKQLLLASENIYFSEAKAPAAREGWRKGHNKGFWPQRLFTRRRESPHAQSRAFRWEYWDK